MKSTQFKLAALGIVAAGLFAFNSLTATGSIKGTVSPSDGGVRAWAESSTDTLRATITNGTFEIVNARPTTYRLIIETKPPYKNVAKDNVTVMDGQPTDVGEIRLEQAK